MGFFDKLMGKGQSSPKVTAESVEYNGFKIQPAPRKQGNSYVTAGVISKMDDAGNVMEHSFIRADTHADIDAACEHSVFKGKQIINESGDRIFKKD